MNCQELQAINDTLKNISKQLQSHQNKISQLHSSTISNNKYIPIIIQIFFTHSPPSALQPFLKFLTDQDLMNIASTCRACYKFIYSPLFYKMAQNLRPIILLKHQQQKLPQFTQITLQQICSDRNLHDADQDDKMAILLTMRTNILATKQKINEINLIMTEYDRKCKEINSKISQIGGLRELQEKKLIVLENQIEKIRELVSSASYNEQALREEQESKIMNRQQKFLAYMQQKAKLERHKELLVNKIKSQQKQMEENIMCMEQMDDILEKVDSLTKMRRNIKN